MLAALMKSPTDYDPVEQPDALGRAHRAWCWTPWSRPARSPPAQRGQGAGPDAEGLQARPDRGLRSISSTGSTARPGAMVGRRKQRPDGRDHPGRCRPRPPPAIAATRRPSRASPSAGVEPGGAGGAGRRGPGAGHGRRRRLCRQRLQPRRRRPPPGRLVVEAVRLSDRAWRPAARRTRLVVDEPVTIDGWSPRNFEPEYPGADHAARRRWRSRSTPWPRASPTRSAGRTWPPTARRLGIVTPINTDPAMALGTTLVTPLEMAQAYDAFSNGGNRVARLRHRAHPHRLGGRVIWQHPAPTPRRR